MKFNVPALFAAIFVGTAVCSPTSEAITSFNQQKAAGAFQIANVSPNTAYALITAVDAAAQSCLLDCGTVILEAACIAAAIAADVPELVLECLPDHAKKICPCAKCVPGLKSFVTKHHLC